LCTPRSERVYGRFAIITDTAKAVFTLHEDAGATFIAIKLALPHDKRNVKCVDGLKET
jgi:hypothetical protein